MGLLFIAEIGVYLTDFYYACKLTGFVLEGQMKKTGLFIKFL